MQDKTTTELLQLYLQIDNELHRRLNIEIRHIKEMTPKLHNTLFDSGIERLNEITDALKIDLLLNNNKFGIIQLRELEQIIKEIKG